MSKKIDVVLLHQRWVHSHEEDTETDMVYRPATFNFPPSRGRASFELKPDGTLVAGKGGPDDRRVESTGTWKLEDGDTLGFYTTATKEPERVIKIVSLDRECMRVRR